LNAGIGNAGNTLDLTQQALGIRIVRGQIVAANLQVDGRRRAEVQDLADNVRGRESKARTGKTSWQLFAQLA
jgi:hypothetical protein